VEDAATAKSAPEAVALAPEPDGDEATAPETIMRRNELVDEVVKRTGMKKRDVRQLSEALLIVVGEALIEGRVVAANPMLKLRPVRQKPFNGGVVVTTKVRVSTPAEEPAHEPLAEPAE